MICNTVATADHSAPAEHSASTRLDRVSVSTAAR
jgi:hypothetical protein